MAANIKRHVTHIKSNVVENGSPKLPTAAQLQEGEIAVNYADGLETLSIKSSSGNIATFTSDSIRNRQQETIAAALNYLNDNKLDASAYTPSSNVDQVINSGTSASTNAVSTKAVYNALLDEEIIFSSALNDLNGRFDDIAAFDKVTVGSTTLYADSSADTLTLSASTFVSLTPDAANDKVTIGVLTGTSNTTLAVGNHTHSSSEIISSLGYTPPYVLYSAVTVTSNLTNQTCPAEITGSSNSGRQAVIIYSNTGSTSYDISISTSSSYKTPTGEQITLTAPGGGYAEINYLNIDGTIYARGV